MSENALSPRSWMAFALSLSLSLALSQHLSLSHTLSLHPSLSIPPTLALVLQDWLALSRSSARARSIPLSFLLRRKRYSCKSGKAYAISVHWHERITFFIIIIIIPKLLLTAAAAAAASSSFILCVQQHHICSVCHRLGDYPPMPLPHEGFCS